MNDTGRSRNGPVSVRDTSGPTDEELRDAIPRGQRSRDFKVGILVLLGVASALTALFLLTDPSTFRGRYRIYTVVEDAGGIRRGDPVQMRGVNVGRVMGFSLEPEGVVIDLELGRQWRIPVDSRSRLVSSGILGGKTVEILEGTRSETLRNGGRIPGEDVAALLDFPPELGQDVQAVLGRIQEVLAEPTVDAVQASARQLPGSAIRSRGGPGDGDRPPHRQPQPVGPGAGGGGGIRGRPGQGRCQGGFGSSFREPHQRIPFAGFLFPGNDPGSNGVW
jgi:hypothetical protein